MGVLVVAKPIPDGSAYTNLVVYSSATITGTYAALNEATGHVIATSGLIYYDDDGTETTWYKYKYYKTTTYSAFSDPVQGSVLEYTTPTLVAETVQVTTFTESTKPKLSTIAQWIKEAQDYIDNETGHAWRERYSETQTGDNYTQNYEICDINLPYESRTGIPVYLGKRKIKDFDADKGDVINIFDGATWYDWIANKTEGRESDYWLENNAGILYVRTFRNYHRAAAVRVKYRYGETMVNNDIRRACTLLVASHLNLSDNGAVILPEGGSSMSISDRQAAYREEAFRLIRKYREISTPIKSI